MFKFNHIELRMLEEMHEEREERRRMRESFSREELLEKFPREEWDDAYVPDESWEERWERRQKEKKEAPKGLLEAVEGKIDKFGTLDNYELYAVNFASKGTMGLFSGFIPAMVLFKSRRLRLAATAVGAGIGLGYAWCQNDLYSTHPESVVLPGTFEEYVNRISNLINSKLPEQLKVK
ncbi:hypothetical protein FOZ63_025215 [Perkinsus olseni]|uniref:MICOS complex subunit n=1 Tax=Perkinsus olseni TaxID=32597 RepID=A0A7J6SCL6_PEROL|nr:hypothetical protein FOZ63_025215 [Perkinsus olseni]KAF4741136.1 hypothetical protein FOZ62_031479 [Perkinsus olseni]